MPHGYHFPLMPRIYSRRAGRPLSDTEIMQQNANIPDSCSGDIPAQSRRVDGWRW